MLVARGGSVAQERLDGKRFRGNVFAEDVVDRERVRAGFERGDVDGFDLVEEFENRAEVSGEFFFLRVGNLTACERGDAVDVAGG